MSVKKSKYRLERAKTALFVIDVQERLLPAMQNNSAVLARVRLLLEAAAVLKLPVVVTEQYPRGLGATVAELQGALGAAQAQVFEKISFSALTEEVLAALRAQGCEQLMVCGMETHVCVWQTVRDLLAAGFQVQLSADAVASRRAEDRAMALDAMREMGVLVTTSESALFDLLAEAGTPEFKAISKLVK